MTGLTAKSPRPPFPYTAASPPLREREASLKKAAKDLLHLIPALVVTVIVALGALKQPDRWVQDALFQRRGVPSTDIIIFGIDSKALDMLGPYNTWTRDNIAYALDVLGADPDNLPAAVAVDVLYAGTTKEKADEHLANAAAKLGCLVTASMAQFGERSEWENGHALSLRSDAIVKYEQAYPALREVAVTGHINAMTDTDSVLRHALLYIEPEGYGRVYSMAFETARMYMAKKGLALKEPAVNKAGHFYVPFTGLPGDYYDGYSVSALILNQLPSYVWKDKIVLIGPWDAALQDSNLTAINKGAKMYGIEYQANVIQSLIDGRSKREVDDLPQLIALFLLCAAAAVFFPRLRFLPSVCVCVGLMAVGFGVPVLLYHTAGLVTHLLWLPACALALYVVSLVERYIRAARERHALELEKERIGAELALAARIQLSALPKETPVLPGYELAASIDPAKEVGGDFYDYFMLDDDHLAFVIADVTGKGVPAALFMMVASALIRHVAMREKLPSSTLRLVNQELCQRNPENMFVTCWLGMLELSTGKLTAANAGHEFPAIRRADGDFELYKDRHGFVLGGMEGVRYRDYEIELHPGDQFFIYTDGLAEATNSANELFGTDRMVEALRACEDSSPADLLTGVRARVDAFVGSAPQFDDLTMLCLRCSGQPEVVSEG